MNVMNKLQYSVIILLLFLFGCTTIEGEARLFGENYLAQTIYDNLNVSIAQPTSDNLCYLFACTNKTARRFFFFTDTSLVNGNCSFLTMNASNLSDVKKFLEELNRTKTRARPFGLAQGPKIIDFNEANAYCNYSYTYSVRFITGDNNGYARPLGTKQNIGCMLSANVIPFFAFYNKDGLDTNYYGSPPANDNAFDIAKSINGLGPVFVATEINPKKEQATFNKVMKQVLDIKNACPNCSVFLSISLDEIYENRRFYLNKSNYASNQQVLNSIDGFAFGIDSRFSRTKDDNGFCGGDAIMIQEVLPLISFINKEFNKSSFIYYVYLPKTDRCVYGDNDYVAIYEQLFTILPALIREGLLGFAPQPFFESTSIFDCDNCALTLYNKTTGNIEDAKYRFNVWFDLCSKYYTGGSNITGGNDYKNGNVLPALRYNADNADLCSFVFPIQDYSVKSVVKPEILPEIINISSKSPTIYKCSFCIDFSEPTPIIKGLSSNINSNACKATDAVYVAADANEIDGVVARAIAYYKSKGDACFISYNNSKGINVDNNLINQLNDAYKKAGCQGSITIKYGTNCDSTNSNAGNACKIDGLGIFSFDYKPSDYASFPDNVKKCMGSEYNPFDINDGICILLMKFEQAYNKADQKASAMSFATTESEKRQLTALLTAMGIVNINSIQLADIFDDILKSGGNCDKMSITTRNLCCTLSSSTGSTSSTSSTGSTGSRSSVGSTTINTGSSGSTSTSSSTYKLSNSACMQSDFASFLNALNLPNYKDAIEAGKLYAAFYKECKDCYSGDWKTNLCNTARRMQVDKQTLIDMGC
ncbi:MAG: hypothetical protein QXP22_01885 [Candidatus Anstonellales archaeon]